MSSASQQRMKEIRQQRQKGRISLEVAVVVLAAAMTVLLFLSAPLLPCFNDVVVEAFHVVPQQQASLLRRPGRATMSPQQQQQQQQQRHQQQQQQQQHQLGIIPFVLHPSSRRHHRLLYQSSSSSSSDTTVSSSVYHSAKAAAADAKSLHPQIGDLVRYYDLDGGQEMGQTLVGRISFLYQRRRRRRRRPSSRSGEGDGSHNYDNNDKEYVVELTPLDDVGGGYFAEYYSSSNKKRSSQKTERLLEQVSPLIASYVASEAAWKVPMTKSSNGQSTIVVRQETYDLDTYQGPVAASINTDVLQSDAERYDALKGKLLRRTVLTGLVGSVLVNLVQVLSGSPHGTEDAIIYAAGSLASVLYLLLLSLKTDTVAGPSLSSASAFSPERRLGSPLANLRFIMPVLLLVGVASYNASRGDANPLFGNKNMLDTVTTEQFAVAIVGFLTYRIPLLVGQIQDAFQELNDDDNDEPNGQIGLTLPGSAGVALQALKDQQQQTQSRRGEVGMDGSAAALTTVLLVSGPQATGRSDLVRKLLLSEKDNTGNSQQRLVEPVWTKRIDDAATFERFEQRDEFLAMDAQSSAGLTKEGVFQAVVSPSSSSDDGDEQRVVVVDADVDLAKKMQRLPGARLVGVWIGLESVADFERRIEADIDAGKIVVPPEETRESVVRGRIKQIISEIEYGLSSGIFEFTILNQDEEQSLKELKEAAEYAFK